MGQFSHSTTRSSIWNVSNFKLGWLSISSELSKTLQKLEYLVQQAQTSSIQTENRTSNCNMQQIISESELVCSLQHSAILASFPGSPGMRTCIRGATKAWCMDQNRKAMFCALFNQLCVQRSVCMIFDPWYMLQVTCYPCSFLCSESSGTPMHARLRSLYPLSTFDAAHMRKNTRLSTPAQLQCLCSEVGEPGNKASAILSIIISNLCIL